MHTVEEEENQTTVTQFIMLGLTTNPCLQIPLFILMLPIYIFTLVGNCSLLITVWFSANLRTPMYFFLTHLALLDLTLSTDISPNMLVHLLAEKKTISFKGCIVQIYFFAACASTEFYLLAAMAFDRYIAICNPLQYTLTMTKSLYVSLIIGSYVGGCLNSAIIAGCLFWLDFCGPNIMSDFVCNYPTLLDLSCTDYAINDFVRFVCSAFIVICSFFVVFASYFNIVRAILKISSASGRQKAASTCISHFTCIFLFYSSVFFMEVTPHANSSEVLYKTVSVILTVIIPALNPLIYSLRNNEVKGAARKLLHRTTKRQ